MHLYDLVKKYLNFSKLESKPLLWVNLGLLFIILSVAFSVSSPILPCLTIIGILVCLRWEISGFAATTAAFILYFILHSFFAEEKNLLWEIGKGSSLLLGILIYYLSQVEVKRFFQKEKENMNSIISDLHLSLTEYKESSCLEKNEAEKNIQTLNEKIKNKEAEVESLLRLVDATCSESDKIYKQNAVLSAESLNHHREIAALTLSINKNRAQITEIESTLAKAEEESKKQLKDLNWYRVEYFQLQLLITSLQTDLKKYRNVIINQRDLLKAIKDHHGVEKRQPEQMTFFPPPPSSKLKTLEKEKADLKKIYDQSIEEQKIVKEELKKVTLRISKASNEDSSQLEEVEKNLQQKLEEKKIEIEQTKAALIRQEREIFVIKKGMQEQGVAAPAYL